MHLWRQQPLNIAIMDRCPLTLERVGEFLKTLPTQAKVVVKENQRPRGGGQRGLSAGRRADYRNGRRR